MQSSSIKAQDSNKNDVNNSYNNNDLPSTVTKPVDGHLHYEKIGWLGFIFNDFAPMESVSQTDASTSLMGKK